MKKPIITLTEKQLNNLMRVVDFLALGHDLHCLDNDRTVEEVREIEQGKEITRMLYRKKKSFNKKVKAIEDKRRKKATTATKKFINECEKEEQERLRLITLERKEMFSYESIELFLKAKYPDLIKTIDFCFSPEEYKIKDLYFRVADSFRTILSLEKKQEKEGKMKDRYYRTINDLLKFAKNSITRQMALDTGLAYIDEKGYLVYK